MDERFDPSNALYKAFFERASVGMAQVDAATRCFVLVNPAFCELTGYDEHELLAMTLDDLSHPDERDADRRRFEHIVDAGDTGYHVEKRYIRKDGSIVWVLVSGAFLRDETGRTI